MKRQINGFNLELSRLNKDMHTKMSYYEKKLKSSEDEIRNLKIIVKTKETKIQLGDSSIKEI